VSYHQHEGSCRQNDQSRSVLNEVICHFPYALLALTIGLITLSMMTIDLPVDRTILHIRFFSLFHTCHFMHILFAAAGCFLTFLRYSRNWLKGFIIGAIVPVIFCVLSDIILPYIGGIILGVPMHLHICFVTEYTNVGIFLIMGILAGTVLRFHVEQKHAGSFLTRWLHFGHILLSALASLFYLISHGFSTWARYIGPVYVLLVIAVVIPCTLSDLVVPVIVAKSGGCDGCNKV
jgi:hypothetical protein